MKTTLDISDPLFNEAKQLAASEKRTLRSVFEEGLSLLLRARKTRARSYTLPDITYAEGAEWLTDDVNELKRRYRYRQTRSLK